MKKLLPLNSIEQSIIVGACAIRSDESLLHFAAHNIRKRIDTINKNKSRDKAEWMAEHFQPLYGWYEFLLFYGAVIGQDQGKLANGIQKVYMDHPVQPGDFHEMFTIGRLRKFMDDLLWLCDNNVILHAKRMEITRLKDNMTSYIPHFEEYAEKVLGDIVYSQRKDNPSTGQG